MSDNNDLRTPEVNKKRGIEQLISPSDGPQGDHANSPHPLRMKEYSSPTTTDEHTEHDVPLTGNSYDLVDLVKTAVCSKEVVEAISAAIVPSLKTMFENMLQPISTKLDSQTKDIATLTAKCDKQNKLISELETRNRKVRNDLVEAEERIDFLEKGVDDLEQYGRRTSLRFHRVAIESTKSPNGANGNRPDTDQIVVDICNNKMNVTPPITVDDIERSHTIGPVRDGHAQVLCKFKHWKMKQRVYMSKSNLKHHKSDRFKVFVTEDLTKKRQFIVQQLELARKDKKLDSFWTSDGRILYKIKPNDRIRSIRQMADIDYLLPDPADEMTANPWDRGNPFTLQSGSNTERK